MPPNDSPAPSQPSTNDLSIDTVTTTDLGRRSYLKLGLVAAGAALTTSLPASDPAAASQHAATADPAPSDTPIGGGDQYSGTVTRDDADTVVETRSGLLTALDSAAHGDIVYIDDDAEIDLSNDSHLTLPAGVTLASGRGVDGSRGALLYVTTDVSRLFELTNDDVRITGIRFRGHRIGYFDPDGSIWHHDSLAIRVFADGCEIDNCEIYGWTHAGIGVGSHTSPVTSGSVHVHHCSIHDNMTSGLGYGLVVYRGECLAEYSYFDANRHSIAGSGDDLCSYEARYNIQGSEGLLFGFEMHTPGGDEIHIHHNTFELVERRDGRITSAVAIRGTPDTGATVENNWFYNPRDPGDDRYMDGSPIVQYHNDAGGDDWDNVAVRNNHYGEDEPPIDVGHPRSDGEPATAQLRVYVREQGIDDEYLTGVTVSIDPHDDVDMTAYGGPYEVTTTADDEYVGEYALFEALPVGTYDVHASHPDYQDGLYEDLELDSSGRQPPIELEPVPESDSPDTGDDDTETCCRCQCEGDS